MHPSHAARLRHRRHQLRLTLDAGHEGLQVLPSNGSGRLPRHKILKASAEFFVGQRNNNRSVPFHGRRKKSSGGTQGLPSAADGQWAWRGLKVLYIKGYQEAPDFEEEGNLCHADPSLYIPSPSPSRTNLLPLSPTRTPSQSEQYVEYIGDRRATPRVKKDKTEKKVRRQKCPNIPGGEELSASL